MIEEDTNVYDLAPIDDVHDVVEPEQSLTAEELGDLLLAQEKMKTSQLEQVIGNLRWEILVHQRRAAAQEEVVAIQGAAIKNKHAVAQIERRLKIRMGDYAFDDLTGKLSLIENTEENQDDS